MSTIITLIVAEAVGSVFENGSWLFPIVDDEITVSGAEDDTVFVFFVGDVQEVFKNFVEPSPGEDRFRGREEE